MMGQRRFDAKLYYNISLDRLIPQDHLLRQIAGAVDFSLTRREELVRPPLSVEEYVRRLYEENDPVPEDEPPGDSRKPTTTMSGLASSGGSRSGGSGRPLRPNEKVQSRTDPEATLVDRPDFGRHLAYKAHFAVSGRRGQVITAAVATTGAAADEHHLAEVLWHHRRLSRLTVYEAVADAKYGTGPNYLYLDKLGITAFIPTTRFGHQHTGIWGRERFQWLPEEDAYLCPSASACVAIAKCQALTAPSIRLPSEPASPAPIGSNVLPRQENVRSTAPGRWNWSRLLRNGWLALWASSVWPKDRSTWKAPSGWGRSCTACAGRGSKGDGASRFRSG